MTTSFKSLSGTIQQANSDQRGFDTNTPLTQQQAAVLKSLGYSFCMRYLSRHSGQQRGDLIFTEAEAILNSGLALGVIQHVMASGWSPSCGLGNEYGCNAAANAASIGLPQGINIWCDLEGVGTKVSASSVIEYCNAWYDAVNSAGYIPGVYVGAGCGLNEEQLYDLKFQHYWKSASNVPNIPHRDYQMKQTSINIHPIQGESLSIDEDVTQTDLNGGRALWLKI